MKNVEDIYRLSPMQQGMLFHTLYAPESGVYFEQLSCVLQGELNISAFQKAWEAVLDRHPALRTAFLWEGLDEPLQVVRTSVSLPWVQQDWRGLSPGEQQARLEALLQAERARGFDLGQAPLMRCALLRLAEDSYQFAWNNHHLLTDGWCLSLVLKEVFAFYEAFRQGRDLRLARPRPYRDYIVWLQQQDLTQAEAFWRQVLQGITVPTPLIVDRTASDLADPPVDYAEQTARLPAALTARLQSLATQHRLTLNTLVQGSWALLLSRYSGEQDVVFGATVSGRPTDLAGVEEMVGLFINTLPVRVHVPPQASLLPWLKQLRAEQVEREQYSYSPLVSIQSWSEVPRGPLFESLVVMENYPLDAALRDPIASLKIRDVRSIERTNYPLTLSVTPGTELALELAYDRGRFDGATIGRMVAHFCTLIEAMAIDPNRRLADLSLLTAAERRQLLVEWHNTRIDCPRDLTIQQLFEAQVEHTPEAIAVAFEDEQLTYRALNTRANQLGHYLRRLGVGPEVTVGICVERSRAMVVGVLGVLKAGGAYVPLDPTYPRERLGFMLEDAQVSVLLTEACLRAELPRPKGSVVCLDAEWEVITRGSEDDVVSGVRAENLAYVIYTSGSTAMPKGVMITHLSLVNAYQAWEHAYRLRSFSSCHLQMAGFSFDVFSGDLVRALCSGGKLVLCPREHLLDPQRLHQLMCKEQVNCAEFVPAVLRNLVHYLQKSGRDLDFMRLLVAGSDSWYMAEYEALRRFCGPQTCLINSYGVSEATIDSTFFENTGLTLPVNGLVPIGRPFANTQTYLLDQQLRPVPVGVPGELHVAGLGLARGYLKRPALTTERFIPNPFSPEPGARLYKTGDLARYLPDGNIEFLGRLDHQVKVRGFRIELGEIESTLCQHPAVREVVVNVREDHPGDKRLLAYVVLAKEHAQDTAELQRFVSQKLPGHIVPSAFVVLEALPLTPNGKVDRRSLPMPEQGAQGSDYVGTRTPVEELLAGIWAEVLHLERVSIHDHFFELGGHSLLAMQVISRVRDTFAVDLPVRCLFASPTLEALGAAIEAARRAHPRPQTPPLKTLVRAEHLPLSFAQERLWFLDQLGGQSATYNIPAAVQLTGPLDVDALARSLTEIVRRHEILRTHFPTINGTPVQVIAPPSAVPLPVVELQDLPQAEQSQEVARLAAEEARQPFDLATGPLLRVALLRLADQVHVVLLTMHHIVSDAWSLAVFMRELSALYSAFVAGAPSPLPELAIQYGDFAQWQRQWLGGEVLKTQIEYWRRQLESAPALLELPADRPRPPVQTFRGATRHFHLKPTLLLQLKGLGRQTGATLFMSLLAAFVTLLFRYSRQEDIVVGSPIANRNRREIEPLIGFFINTLVLRTDLSENPTFRDLLAQVRQAALEAYTHQDVPFEQLVDALQPQRNLSHSPLFQVLFALQNTPLEDLELPGLSLTPLEVESPAAKFDLSLALTEAERGLSGELEYNSDLFDAATIDRMLSHYRTLLEAIVAHPDQRVSELRLLTEAEERQLLLAWNQTQTDDREDGCIHQRFEAMVERSPDAVAVVFKDQQLTYRELNAQANRLAHHLRGLGVGPEVLIGICTQRSPAMLVGLLGVLKAGGAYVPLDPAYPRERLAFMLEDAQVSVLLTQESLLASFPEHKGHVVCLDTDWKSIAQASEQPPPSEVALQNLAYVIYTSGSTGKPKGVLVTHRGLCNLARSQIQTFAVQPSSRVLQFASPSFDASVSEVFMALCAGASLCLGSADELLPGPALLRLLKQQAVTHMTLPPSALAALPAEELSALRAVIVAGEACPSELVTRWSAGRCFFNAYGPTEATVCATIAECSDSRRRPPIGRPIANTEVYILDDHLRPAPVGVLGELHIGGIGLARGYLNRPELTDERFIANPHVPGTRLYKTGDLARYLSDGNIEFLGRLDQQVKIRGFRIEPGEIEHALGNHLEIGKAVVLATENNRGAKTLTAFVTRKKPVELWPSIAEFFVYDDVVYRSMATHESRNHRYRAAFRKVLKGKKVVEIGPGPDAILSRLSLEAGAEKVYAIEILEDTYRKAQQTVKSLGLEDRIVLIHGDATQAELPEKVDFCISEIVGSIGGAEGAAKIINSARRFLHDPRCMIPRRSLTKLAALTLPESVIDFRFPEIAAHYVDKIFAQVGYPFDLRICLKNLSREHIISTADVFEDLDYTLETPLEATHDITLTFTKDAVFHGILVWLTLYTDQEQVVDILEEQESWLPVYFPLYQAGVEVAKGDVLEGSVSRCLSENSLNPDYRIQGRLRRQNGDVVSLHYHAYHFKRLYKSSPFFARLFADDRIPVRPRLSGNALRTYLAGHLPDYMLPARFVELAHLPLTPNGKVDRHALLRLDTFQESERGYVAPGTPTEEALARIWGGVLGRDRVGIQDNFFELGGHSLVAVRLMAQIQQAFGRHLPLALLFQAPTIEQLATLLREQTDVASWSSLVPMQPGGSALPLFCVPGGGGNVLYFHALVQHLGPEQPFYGLQAQGLDGESAPHTRVEDMAAYYIQAIQAVQPQGPYLLSGHSFGGWVAFEMAQQLRKCGHEVARVFILDTPAPVFAGTPTPDDADDDVAVMVTIARLAERLFGQSLGVTHAELQALDWEAQLQYLNERLQAANLLPRGSGVHQVSGLVQVFRAVSRIQYLPTEAQLTPITLLRASESNSEDAFNDSLALPRDRTWGWSRFAAGRVEVYAVPGDHITMMAEPHVRSLAERLSACLAQLNHAASAAAGWK